MRRRVFMQGLLAGSTAAVVSATASASPQIEPLLAPLERGSTLAGGWVLSKVSAVLCGASVLSLVHPERKLQASVHVCRRGGSVRGIAHSDTLELFVMNNGDGKSPTDESIARAAREIAAALAANERAGVGVPEKLLRQDEREGSYRSTHALL
jgi:hypothetical protein